MSIIIQSCGLFSTDISRPRRGLQIRIPSEQSGWGWNGSDRNFKSLLDDLSMLNTKSRAVIRAVGTSKGTDAQHLITIHGDHPDQILKTIDPVLRAHAVPHETEIYEYLPDGQVRQMPVRY